METLRPIFQKAQDGDLNAYGIIVQRFQDMAVGYGYAVLGDFHLAEDVAQEAFVEAYQHITRLSSPFAFPGWLRKILFKHCDRHMRQKRLDSVSLNHLVIEIASDHPTPDEEAEKRDMEETIQKVIQALPKQERTVVSMFYMSGYAHKDISSFLDIPISTVKSRLYSARQKLKERLLYMVEDHMNEQAPSKDQTFKDGVLKMIQPDEMKTPEWVYHGYEAVDGNEAWALMCASAVGDLKTIKTLLKKDPRLIHAGFWYQFPLHMAIRKGHLEVVRFLLKAGSDPGRSWGLVYAWEQVLEMAAERGFEAIKAVLETKMKNRFGYDEKFAELRDAIIGRDREQIDMILEAQPELVLASDTVGNNAVHWAVMTRQLELIDYFLEKGVDINARRADNYSPLELSITCNVAPGEGVYWLFRHLQKLSEKTIANHWVVPGYLLARGAEYTFYAAVVLGDMERVEQYLSHTPELARQLGPGWYNPLSIAAKHGQLRLVQMLLDAGADPRMPEHNAPQGCALPEASAAGHADIVELLLVHGADINASVDSSGDSLSLAQYRGHGRVVEILRAHGAEDEQSSGYRFTEMCSVNDVNAARAKLEEDASFADDSWAFQIAVEKDFKGIIDLFLAFNPDLLKRINRTNLYKGTLPTLRRLLEHGLNVNLCDWLSVTPLHKMAIEGDTERIALWLEYGADINAVEDEYSSTPLAWAAREGKKDIIVFLLDHGADPNMAGADWATPLAWATRKGYKDIADLLMARGAR